MEQLIILLLFLGLMWFVLIRPQQKQQKQRKQMLSRLEVGDDVVTIGGLHGNVVAIDEGTGDGGGTVDLVVTTVGGGGNAEDVVLRFRRSAIGEVAGLDDAGDADAAADEADDDATEEA